jgi:hypothetical protein
MKKVLSKLKRLYWEIGYEYYLLKFYPDVSLTHQYLFNLIMRMKGLS